MLEKIQCTVICNTDDETKTFNCGNDETAVMDDYRMLVIIAEDGNVVLIMEKNTITLNDLNAIWVKEEAEKYGIKPSFF